VRVSGSISRAPASLAWKSELCLETLGPRRTSGELARAHGCGSLSVSRLAWKPCKPACSLQQIRIATGYVPVSRPWPLGRQTRRLTSHRQRDRDETRARRATWKPTYPTAEEAESGNTHEDMPWLGSYLLSPRTVTTEWNVSRQRKRLQPGVWMHFVVAAGSGWRAGGFATRTGMPLPCCNFGMMDRKLYATRRFGGLDLLFGRMIQ
jgi:hypothetical protein